MSNFEFRENIFHKFGSENLKWSATDKKKFI